MIWRIFSAAGATAKRAAHAVHRCLLYRHLLDLNLLDRHHSHLHHRHGPQTRHRPLPARVQPSPPPPRPHPVLCTKCSRKPSPPPRRPHPDLCTKCSRNDPLRRHLLKRPRNQSSRSLLNRRKPHRHSPRAALSMAVVRETWTFPTARTGARPRVRVGSAPGATVRAAPFARLRRHHRYQCRCRHRRHQARHLGRDRLHLRIHRHHTSAGITTMEAFHWSASTMHSQCGRSTPAPAATNAQ